MTKKIQSGEIPLDLIIITDEPYFYMNCNVNKQNLRY